MFLKKIMEDQNLLLGVPKKSKYWKFAAGFLAIIILFAGGYFVWDKYLSPEAISNRETAKNYQKYLDWQKNFEEAMKKDTYGGKTPEETLKMFIDALKKDDVELASKYFMLETNTNDPNYLTRKKWEDTLAKTQEQKGFKDVIDIISKMTLDEKMSSSNTTWFALRNSEGIVDYSIILIKNKYSNVWKIESM